MYSSPLFFLAAEVRQPLAGGENDTGSIDKVIKAVVTVEYAIR
ncbi:MAG: hypothetical protein WC058_00335 [Phycisphaeraceae bacterium]